MNQSRSDLDLAQYHDEVSRVAFDIYTQHGSQGGNDLHDWFDAERHVNVSRNQNGYFNGSARHGWLAMIPVMTANDVPQHGVI